MAEERVLAWLEECGRLNNFAIGQYGGGEDFKLCTDMKECILDIEDTEEILKIKQSLVNDANEWIDQYLKLPKEKQILSLQNHNLKVHDLEWKNTILVVPCLQNISHYNVLLHGRLLRNEFDNDINRLGASSWPLAGFYEMHNILQDNLVTKQSFMEGKSGNISPWLGCNWVNAVDQHCHWVEEYIEIDSFPIDLSAWHIGGDMGRFSVSNKNEIAFGWIAWVCSERKLAQISLVVIKPPNCDNEQIENFKKKISDTIWSHCEPLL